MALVRKIQLLLFGLILVFSSSGWSDALEDARVAFKGGHLEAASQLLKPLADSEKPEVQALSRKVQEALKEKANVTSERGELILPGKPGEDPMDQLIAKLSTQLGQDVHPRCFSDAQIHKMLSEARNQAVQEALKNAEAIAAANEVRQQRAVERMRTKVAEEVEAKLRKSLETEFKTQVDARVAAIVAGKNKRAAPLAQLQSPSWEGDVDSLKVAANNADQEAQYRLGELYFTGQQVPIDYSIAHYWWQEAARNGSQKAVSALDMLVPRMRPEPFTLH